MSAEVFYQFFQGDRLLGEGRIQAPFTVGRQTDAALPPPVSILELASGSAQLAGNEGISRKLVIVPLSNRTVPRLSLKIELDTSGKILACNIHGTVELHLGSHEPLRPKQQLPLGTAGTICFPEDYQLRLVHQPASTSEFPATSAVGGGTLIAFDDEPPPFGESKSSKPQHRPGMGIFVDNPSDNGEDATHRSFTAFEPMLDESQTQTTRLLSMIAAKEADNHQELAVRLVRAALEAFKEPPGSKEFFDAAGRAAIQMIDLDRVAVLRKEREQWVCRTLCFRPGLEHSRATTRPFSRTLLSQMELNARTTCVASTLR